MSEKFGSYMHKPPDKIMSREEQGVFRIHPHPHFIVVLKQLPLFFVKMMNLVACPISRGVTHPYTFSSLFH